MRSIGLCSISSSSSSQVKKRLRAENRAESVAGITFRLSRKWINHSSTWRFSTMAGSVGRPRSSKKACA